MKSDFYTAIAQIAAERGIPREAVLSSVEHALKSVYKKMANTEEEVEVVYQGEELEVGFNVNYLLDALAANSGDRPILLVMGRRAHEVATLAHSRGLSDSTRFAGGTERADALLAAADIVAIPWSSKYSRAAAASLALLLRWHT